MLIGGTGCDVLEGGADAKRFVFASGDFGTISKPDVVADDVNGGNVIDLPWGGGADLHSFGGLAGTAGEVRTRVQ